MPKSVNVTPRPSVTVDVTTGPPGPQGPSGPPGPAGSGSGEGSGIGAPGGRWTWVEPPNGRDLAPGQVGIDDQFSTTELRIRVEDLDGNDWYDPVLTFLGRGNRIVLTQVDDPTVTWTYEVLSGDWNDDGSTFWVPVAFDPSYPHAVWFADGAEVTVAFLFGLTPSGPPPGAVLGSIRLTLTAPQTLVTVPPVYDPSGDPLTNFDNVWVNLQQVSVSGDGLSFDPDANELTYTADGLYMYSLYYQVAQNAAPSANPPVMVAFNLSDNQWLQVHEDTAAIAISGMVSWFGEQSAGDTNGWYFDFVLGHQVVTLNRFNLSIIRLG